MPTDTGRLEAQERHVVESVRLDVAWDLVEEFSTLVRDAGSEDERRAVTRITKRLDDWNVNYQLHEPELLIGLPLNASVTVDGESFPAKTPSMAAATPPGGLRAAMVHEHSAFAASVTELLTARGGDIGVRGKIVLTEGIPIPNRIRELQDRGAVGVVMIAPGERIHEMISTPIWGSPDLTTWAKRPSLPVVAITRSAGEQLARRLRETPVEGVLRAKHDTGWRKIPILVAEIPGQIEPERFILVHGHLDSWHVGVGDNATGDAVLLELTRVLHQHRKQLARTVRVAWWSGHSQGRYAGSTWYADEYALDIERNCICHINCDSPGCRDADVFEDVPWMAEAEPFAKAAIRDFTGQVSSGMDPPRAGDMSFTNLGVSMFFMLTSTMSAAKRAEKGYYPVAGCGGNIEWHTEDDTLEIADPHNLLRDIRLYTGAAFRAANSPLLPLDFRLTVDQIETELSPLAARTRELVAFTNTIHLLKRLRLNLDRLYDQATRQIDVQHARATNDALIAIGRQLVRVLYTRTGAYRQDPAVHSTLLPGLTSAVEAIGTVPDGIIRTELIRLRNTLDNALLTAITASASES